MAIKPNGPRGYPFIGSLPKLASSGRVEWLQSITNTYGDVVEFKLLKKNFYLINHPDLMKDILTRDIDNYTKKTISFKFIKEVLGESTFTAMGDDWRRKRLTVQPSFRNASISNLAIIMTDCIDEFLTEWESQCDRGNTIELSDAMMHLTLKVVVKALFSTTLSDTDFKDITKVFKPLLEAVNARISFPVKILYRLPLTKNKKYQGYIETLDVIIYRIIRDRRLANNKPTDLLQMLMDATDEETGLPLTDIELRNELMTMFIAGHETTANAMSWLWTILSSKSDIREKIEQEVDEVLGKRKPDASDFANLPYCLKVFKETMRLYPPVPILPRQVEHDTTLGGYLIKGGSGVLFSPHLLHRHPKFWDAPEVFDPNRFDKAEERKRHTYAYLPFGGGARVCIGNNFALMEAVFIIAMTTQRFRVNLNSDTNFEPLVGLTTKPKFALNALLQRRRAKNT
ncbi:cytochrome P450 [Porticoccaceae bacterium]|nr:cytochrome P450 [Porticoccaceae bacterium]